MSEVYGVMAGRSIVFDPNADKRKVTFASCSLEQAPVCEYLDFREDLMEAHTYTFMLGFRKSFLAEEVARGNELWSERLKKELGFFPLFFTSALACHYIEPTVSLKQWDKEVCFYRRQIASAQCKASRWRRLARKSVAQSELPGPRPYLPVKTYLHADRRAHVRLPYRRDDDLEDYDD